MLSEFPFFTLTPLWMPITIFSLRLELKDMIGPPLTPYSVGSVYSKIVEENWNSPDVPYIHFIKTEDVLPSAFPLFSS